MKNCSHQQERLSKIRNNIKNYTYISYFNSTILIWGVMTLYYSYKGLTFFEIAVLQSIGSGITTLLEIPSGWISDKFGHTINLRISAIMKFLAVFFLLIANNFYLFLISEFCSSIASSSQSGSDTALFYESLTTLHEENNYVKIISSIKGKQAIFRFFIRLLAPIFFGIFPELPFIISLFIYSIIILLTFNYTSTKKSNHNSEIISTKNDENTKKRYFFFRQNKKFIFYSLLSAFTLIAVSNYSQYIGPFLQTLGLNINYLGIVLAAASLGEYLGTKFTSFFGSAHRLTTLLALSLSIFSLLICIGSTNSLIIGAFGYFCINSLHSIFIILLGQSLNKLVDNTYRATLLSISSLINEIVGIVSDPILGKTIDIFGFNVAYLFLGLISFFVLILVILFLFYKRKKTV